MGHLSGLLRSDLRCIGGRSWVGAKRAQHIKTETSLKGHDTPHESTPNDHACSTCTLLPCGRGGVGQTSVSEPPQSTRVPGGCLRCMRSRAVRLARSMLHRWLHVRARVRLADGDVAWWMVEHRERAWCESGRAINAHTQPGLGLILARASSSLARSMLRRGPCVRRRARADGDTINSGSGLGGRERDALGQRPPRRAAARSGRRAARRRPRPRPLPLLAAACCCCWWSTMRL